MATALTNRLTTYRTSPEAFRDDLFIDAGRFGDVVTDFQKRDFQALDRAFVALARGEPPAPGRLWFEHTKGASKDSDVAMMLTWLLAFSPRTLSCEVGAADKDQAGELLKIIKGFLRRNDWLGQVLEVQNWSLVNPHTDSRCQILAADAPSAHGSRPNVVFLNELSHVGSEDFAQTLLDNAAKVPGNLVVICTNAGHLERGAFPKSGSA